MDKRGLYSYTSTLNKSFKFQRKLIDFLMYSDGKNSVEEISRKINLDLTITNKLLKILLKNKLVII